MNRLFVLSFQNENDWRSYKQYYLPIIKIKDDNVMIDGLSFFDQPVKNDFKVYDNIQKLATGQGDHYTTGCLLDHPYSEKLTN